VLWFVLFNKAKIVFRSIYNALVLVMILVNLRPL